MLLSDLEIYVEGIKSGQGDMYLCRKYLLKRLFDLGMPMGVAQKTLSIITFSAPDKNLAKLDRIATVLYNLYKAVNKEFGQITYYSQLERIKSIQ